MAPSAKCAKLSIVWQAQGQGCMGAASTGERTHRQVRRNRTCIPTNRAYPGPRKLTGGKSAWQAPADCMWRPYMRLDTEPLPTDMRAHVHARTCAHTHTYAHTLGGDGRPFRPLPKSTFPFRGGRASPDGLLPGGASCSACFGEPSYSGDSRASCCGRY